MMFIPTTYTRLRTRLERKYAANLNQVLKTISPLSDWLQDGHEVLKQYSPVKWYFLKQIQSYLEIYETLPALSESPDEFSKLDDEIFENWNRSEFADVFLKALNQGKSIKAASEIALKHFEQHLITMGERQLYRLDKTHPSYRVQSSLGEYKKGKKVSKLLETTLHLEGKDLNLMTSSLKEMKSFSQRIEVALKVIKKFSPKSWDRFIAFTEVIIPIHQDEFVSYSHQELPGYSMINMYDRDFVDLMDDLLHENGHHHLNYYLNLGKVIDEPVEAIYYSPWRRTLRPLRGVYHAYFTFFWAFELFSTLAEAREQDSIFYLFSAREKEKIYWRAVEEYWMLDYTYADLQKARRKHLISDTGWTFIQEQRKALLKRRKNIEAWEKKLKFYRPQLRDLKKNLNDATKAYR